MTKEQLIVEKYYRQQEVHRQIVELIVKGLFYTAVGVGLVLIILGTRKAMYYGQELSIPTAGYTAHLTELSLEPVIEPLEVEIVESAEEVEHESEGCFMDETEYILMGSTAYYNINNSKCASGVYPRANHTLAGMVSWLGGEVELYECNKDMSVGKCLGRYKFEDTGYGRSIKRGASKIIKGKPLGDIEAGLTIDVFFDTLAECKQYGRRNIYMKWIEEVQHGE